MISALVLLHLMAIIIITATIVREHLLTRVKATKVTRTVSDASAV